MSERKHLGDLLVEAGIITTKTLERALERQKQASGKRLGSVLEEMGVITEEEVMEALAKQFGFKTVTGLANYTYPAELLQLVPEKMAMQRLIFPLKQKEQMLALAITDPYDTETIDLIAARAAMKVVPVLTTRKEILAAIQKFYLKGEATEDARRKILVVEDSPPVATVIEVALSKEGFKVTVAKDGLEGLKIAVRDLPDLVICDSVMPQMDGFGLMRALRGNQATAAIPVILLTSKASTEDERRALEMGFLDFIPKPVQPVRIVARVKHAFQLVERYK